MTPQQAALLALVQAATEFLPVSSSGHLILIPRLLGWPDQGLEFDIAMNTGTLVALLAYFRADLARLLRAVAASVRPGGAAAIETRTARALLLGTIPAAVAGLLAREWIATGVRGWQIVAWNAIVFGLLLLVADRFGRRNRGLDEIGERQGLWIGCAQALALIPGTSRSGVTMTAALALGYSRDAAARFSFLLAIPIGLLVGAKQAVDLMRGAALGVPPGALAVGIVVAALAGYLVIAFLLGWVRTRSLAAFAIYRLALGGVLFLYFG